MRRKRNGTQTVFHLRSVYLFKFPFPQSSPKNIVTSITLFEKFSFTERVSLALTPKAANSPTLIPITAVKKQSFSYFYAFDREYKKEPIRRSLSAEIRRQIMK